MFLKLMGEGPLWQQVYQALRGAILSGALPPRARLPATRVLAKELRVSRNTILLAYEQLLAEGYVVGQVGSGTYVAAVQQEWAATSSARPAAPTATAPAPVFSDYGQRVLASAFSLSPGAAAFRPRLRYDFRYGAPAVEEFPHETWRRLLARRARNVSLRSLHYGPPQGYLPLREAIAAYLRRSRAVSCDPQQVLIVSGSQQALDLSARLLLNPGEHVILEEPHYQGARYVFLAAGGQLLPAPVDPEGMDIRGLATASARLAYITPSHQFPTGAIMSLARRLALLQWAEQAEAYVLEDDYDSEYRYEGHPVEAVQGLDRAGRVIYVGTFSKVLFPALRLGYMVLPQPLVPLFTAAKWLTDRHSSTLEQEVLSDFISEGHFERHLRRTRTHNAARRAVLLEALERYLSGRVDIMGENAGMHLLVWLRGIPPATLDVVIDKAAAAGVGIYSVASYYLTPPERAGLLLGYTALSTDDIVVGIQRLAQVLDTFVTPQ